MTPKHEQQFKRDNHAHWSLTKLVVFLSAMSLHVQAFQSTSIGPKRINMIRSEYKKILSFLFWRHHDSLTHSHQHVHIPICAFQIPLSSQSFSHKRKTLSPYVEASAHARIERTKCRRRERIRLHHELSRSRTFANMSMHSM